MKNSKKGLLAVALISVALLGACGNKKAATTGGNSVIPETSTTQYNYVYGTDPDNFDYTVSMRNTNSSHYANFIDGLVENDRYGQIKPDLATSWKVSDDGLTYTYKIRKGVKWVDSEGNEYATVKAEDWVTALKHAVAAKSETLYVVQGSIKGLDDYVNGKTTDFSTVGVKAVDDYTLEYTLNQPETYWNSKLTYGIMFPVNAKFLKEKGSDFGKPKADAILYNGAYTLANFTSKSVIEYAANKSYWDKKNVHVKDVKLTYNDGSNPDGLYKSFKKGDFTASRVYPNSAGYDQVVKDVKNDINWSDQDASVYNFTFNLDRKAYGATSKKTDSLKSDTKKAILNKSFRQAIQAAFDKGAYNAQVNGKEGETKSLRNEMTPPAFVSVDGQDYGKQVETDLAALDSDAWGAVNLADAQDATYNVDRAKKLFAQAKKELKAAGVAFPIHLDLPVDQKAQLSLNQSKSFKSSVEKSLGTSNVVIDIQMLSEDKYLAATYQATTGAAADFDISNASGWSPDYDDPSSYLDIYDPNGGTMLTTLGIEPGADKNAAAKKAAGLDTYATLLAKAEAITDDTNARYKAFAAAEAQLLDSTVQIPVFSLGGSPSVSKVVPYTAPFAWSGLGSSKFKFMKIQASPVTITQKTKAKKAWEKKRAEIAKEAAKE
ncbi:peptide ABC transporter substrate-binding protein [Lapidilactobacillus achengensis]|uniref:Peptide ABC transporter substrate-binding protein n=1 Tax=Lapidilactobacillus achengensis TaxID=2486000 RepID=A0ABW1UKE3_9LACO|nr:peptide ABC transporter substrate-binding protein [Lapidilactobacillus achengensis]